MGPVEFGTKVPNRFVADIPVILPSNGGHDPPIRGHTLNFTRIPTDHPTVATSHPSPKERPEMATATPSSPAAPAGWYRDPLGLPQLRWWNGMTWTNTIQEQRPEFPVGESAGSTEVA